MGESTMESKRLLMTASKFARKWTPSSSFIREKNFALVENATVSASQKRRMVDVVLSETNSMIPSK